MHSVMSWFNSNAPVIEAIATAGLVVITAYYAWITKRMVQGTEKLAEASAEQVRLQRMQADEQVRNFVLERIEEALGVVNYWGEKVWHQPVVISGFNKETARFSPWYGTAIARASGISREISELMSKAGEVWEKALNAIEQRATQSGSLLGPSDPARERVQALANEAKELLGQAKEMLHNTWANPL